jgi:hypothetical protein
MRWEEYRHHAQSASTPPSPLNSTLHLQRCRFCVPSCPYQRLCLCLCLCLCHCVCMCLLPCARTSKSEMLRKCLNPCSSGPDRTRGENHWEPPCTPNEPPPLSDEPDQTTELISNQFFQQISTLRNRVWNPSSGCSRRNSFPRVPSRRPPAC